MTQPVYVTSFRGAELDHVAQVLAQIDDPYQYGNPEPADWKAARDTVDRMRATAQPHSRYTLIDTPSGTQIRDLHTDEVLSTHTDRRAAEAGVDVLRVLEERPDDPIRHVLADAISAGRLAEVG